MVSTDMLCGHLLAVRLQIRHHHHHRHHLHHHRAIIQLVLLPTQSGPTHLEFSSMLFSCSFCLLVCHFYYRGSSATRNSVDTHRQISSLDLYFVQNWGVSFNSFATCFFFSDCLNVSFLFSPHIFHLCCCIFSCFSYFFNGPFFSAVQQLFRLMYL